jgi:hypothetical protein
MAEAIQAIVVSETRVFAAQNRLQRLLAAHRGYHEDTEDASPSSGLTP